MEQETKTCGRCWEKKLKSEYYPNKATKDGLMAWCIACFTAYQKSYRSRRSGPRIKTDHEHAIDNFIPQALEIAKERVSKMVTAGEFRPAPKYHNPGKDLHEYYHDFTVEIFHREMNRLTAEAGLRVL